MINDTTEGQYAQQGNYVNMTEICLLTIYSSLFFYFPCSGGHFEQLYCSTETGLFLFSRF